MALSYQRKTIEFSEQTTLNTIYQDLLYAVHERQWDHGRHEAAKHLDINQFTRVLEEIALAVWHDDGRTATVGQIFRHCENSNLTRYLEVFQEGAKRGVSRLLTAFYFRQSEQLHAGDKTFEFTHKSFGEYLTARRIIRLVKQIHDELTRHDEDPDTGFDEREALKRWAELCGPTTMDRYVFQFLCDEVAGNDQEGLHAWQQTFARLIGFAVRKGVPMELTDVARFKDMMRQSRNAEEALMVVHYACAIRTRRQSEIPWGNESAFGEWIKRLQGQRTGQGNRLILDCLAFLDLRDCTLYHADFFRAVLSGSCLEKARLTPANLGNANLDGALLYEANLEGANLEGAHLERAYLEGANLERVNLKRANLDGANLKRTILER